MPTKEEKAAYDKAYRAKNRAWDQARKRAYRAANRAVLADMQRAYRQANKEKVALSKWRSAGLPEPARPRPTHCECCGDLPARSLTLDHCHSTGQFRGWLCRLCNISIGQLGDSVAGLERAIAYLRRAYE